jgi:hypothetical protein
MSFTITKEHLTNNRVKKWATAGIIISWLTFWVYIFLPFGFIAWIGILMYLIIKESKLKWYLILSAWLFVPSCNFLTGTVRYFTGTATLQDVGRPRPLRYIDRETRLDSKSFGCMMIGYELFVFPANNAAVKLWTNLFGFQRGSYKGAFPTEEEAQKIIQTADTITVTNNKEFLLFNTVGQAVRININDLYGEYQGSYDSVDKVVGKTIKNECFIFKWLKNKDRNEGYTIYIVDISKSQLLTTYSYDQ